MNRLMKQLKERLLARPRNVTPQMMEFPSLQVAGAFTPHYKPLPPFTPQSKYRATSHVYFESVFSPN